MVGFPSWDCPHWRVVPFQDLNLLRNQARQINHFLFLSIKIISFYFIVVINLFLPNSYHCVLCLKASKFLLFYHVIPSCYNIFVIASSAVGTWPRSQQRGPSLCTSWLGVSFSQASPNSPTLELLGHNVVGNSPPKITKRPTTIVKIKRWGRGRN